MSEFDSGRVIRPLQKALDESREMGIDAVLCSTEIVEKVIELLKEQEQTINALESDLKETLEVVAEQSNVVRCKDCKWWHESEREEGFGDCGQANGITLKPSNWFCADGVKKDG